MADRETLSRYLRKVTGELRGSQRRVLELERRSGEPIAIVGMACRYPGGVGSPADLWALVAEGHEGISGFPSDRGWDFERLYHPDPDNPGTSYARAGGFLVDPGHFDPEFFGISPREALATDPQQRLLLEASWEALEGAGIDPATLRGEQAGVFAGVMHQDYGASGGPAGDLEGHMGTGNSASAASGRVAYTLGLEGPAMTVDTACSSSLVAIHLAAQALRGGECTLALAGGVTVLTTPETFTEFSRQRALSPDGRCRSFAEAADGVGVSEGVGILCLQRLSDARRAGNPVLATIRGSAVNQDGASNGLTAPNGPSQERVIRQALASARLAPRDVDAVEAHGTGTTLGDPIEAGALLATYGQDRDRPLKLGSVKSNIGHTQAAAGVAGVIKAVLAMREGVLPKTLHVDAPSAKVEWGVGRIELLREAEPWGEDGRPRRVGVSSFGASGTNAHLILEGVPGSTPGRAGTGEDPGGSATPSEPQSLPGPIPLLISAKSEQALTAQAERLASHLKDNPDLDPTDLAYSLATTRSAFEHRAVAIASSREQALSSLSAIAVGEEAPGVARGLAHAAQGPVFLFPGYGAQWQGMGAELLDRSPAFAAKAHECIEAFQAYVDWSLEDVLRGTEGARSVHDPDVGSLALFTTMVGLAELWRSCGVEPSVVMGHSQGEVVAAHLAGGLSLSDAVRVTAVRTQAFQPLVGQGAIASVAAPAEQLEERLGQWEGRLELAAINGPSSTVVSGDIEPLDELLAQCEQEGLQARKVSGAIAASHSAQFEVLREEVLAGLASISPHSGDVPFHSTVTGELLDTKELDAEYWFRNMRQTVRLEPVVTSLIGKGHRILVEVSSHPVLAISLGETAEAVTGDPGSVAVLSTLRRDEGTSERFALSLAGAHAGGAKVDWERFFAGTGAERVPLPTYPFQRKRYWLQSGHAASDPTAIGQSAADHPLLGASVSLAGTERRLLTGRLSLETHPWLADHAASGVVILPGTAFLELALRAGEEAGCEALEELTLHSPLLVPEKGAVALQVTVSGPDEQGRREIEVHSRAESEAAEDGEWTCNAQGVLGSEGRVAPDVPEAWPPSGAEPIYVDDLYERLADAGIEYGPAFQGLGAAWRAGEEICAEVSLPRELASEARRFAIHPALLDAALHGIWLSGDGVGGELRMPFAWSGVSLQGAGAAELRVRLRPEGEGGMSLSLADGQGVPLGTVASLSARPVDPSQLAAPGQGDALLAVEWREQRPGEPEPYLEIEDLSEIEGREGAEIPGTVLWPPRRPEEGTDLAATARSFLASVLAQVQGWLGEERLLDTRLAILTEGALASGEGEDSDPVAASIWGLLRSAQSEHPERFVLIDTDGSEASAEAIGAALSLEEEPQLAIREGRVLVPRAVPVPPPEEGQRPALDCEGTVLITGATGGLGSLVARHLVEAHGARHLLLASRSGERAEGAGELVAELEELGAEVKLSSCDVSDPAQLEELCGQIPDAHPLTAIFHSAGTLDDATIEALSPEQIERVFAPKADAAWHLHELSKDADLSAFVLFSSAAGALGAPGQANYAAANSFLDALAQRRRAQGLPATSIAWGLWQRESAMGAHLGEDDLARMRRAGAAPLSDEQGLALFDRALATAHPATLALSLDPAGLRGQARAGVLAPLLRSLVRVPARRRSAAGSSLAARLAGLDEAEREAHVLGLVRTEVATVLGHGSAEAIEPERAFKELGFDSLAAVELRNRLAASGGLRLAATVVFDYPNAKALAGHLAEVTTGGAAKQVAVRAQAADEPIAILGMACRYPGGAGSPAELWALLAEGREGVTEFPADRGWDLERLFDPDPDNPGTSYVREGGFLADPARFDAEFFGVSPREALATDPQQRLLLEASWEALEAAGIDPASLRGEQAGVFAGVMHQDYGASSGSARDLEGYAGTGNSASVTSGRISYVLGLEGPAMTIDTACSSSLVAIHLAAQALRGGECSLALAGGVTVLTTPETFTGLSRQRALSPDGRCKSFAEAADGVGLAEGVGVLALARLSDAQRQGHPILALLKGSAVNQDGASNGLSSPNGPSQERVIRQALANADLAPQDVDAVEAHGTGTDLGDPIEAGALLATYGQDRERPLKLGSIKSNIGHTAAAAGVAGVIKTVMAMREGMLPKTLHVDEPSSHVDWEAGRVELLREAEPWERNGQPRRAGVSSFGISGTNAHVILEGAPEPAGEAGDLGQGSGAPSEAAQPLPGPVPLTLSAKSEEALAAQAERLSAHLKANPDLDPTDLAYSLATTRSSFAHRAVLVGGDREELLGSLVAIAQGKEAPGIARGLAKADQNPVFLFPGQGSQWQGMGAELLDRSPSFARHMDECEEALSPHLDFSVREVLTGESEDWLGRIETIQPALFAVMVSLARLWEELGVKPAAVLGHSQGEIAAAHLAGGLSLDDAARIAALRSQLISRLSGQGAMASVSLSPERLGGLLEPWEGRIEVAAQNGPTSMTLSAEREALDEFLAQCEQEGVRAREVAATIPSHSARVEPLREELLEALAPISPQSGHVPFHSTVTGELLDTKELDAEYWYRNLRQPVRFEAVTKDLLAQGQRSFLEISPHPVLAFAAEETIEDALGEEEATYLPTLRRDEGTPERFCLSLAGAHAAGAKVDWEAFFKASSAKRVPLPTYPFQRKRYWLDSTMGGGDAGAIGLGDPEHPLLGAALEDPSGEGLTLTGRLSLATHPWLADHAAAGTVLLPGTAFLELALSAGERVGAPSVEELTIAAPLILTEGAAVALQVKVGSPEEEGRREVSVHSRPEAQEEAEWVRHAQGALLPEQGQEAPLEPPGTWPPQGAEPLELEFLYDRLAEMGLEYGPAFQGLHSAWQEGETIYAEASLPQEQANEAQRFALHPALLDSALHAVALGAGAGMEPRLPFAWSEVSLQSVGAQELRLRLEPKAEGTVSISLFDAAGEPMGRVGSLAARPLDPSLLKAAGQGDQDGLLAIEWRELPAGEPLEFTEISNLSDLAGQEDAEVSAAVLWRVPREEGADPPANALALTATALEQIQAWLADERLAETRLAILTEGAVASSGEEDPDLPAASLWGLLRSAQTEHPERFVLLDTDGSEASAEAIGAALSLEEEPQLAIREGKVLVPRAAPVPVPDTAEEQRPSLDPDKTVLITGATGGLGSLVARHLVEAHGARHLLLASRSGAKAEGAGELLAQLEELGAKAKLASCDVSDPTQLKKLVAQIPKANPLGAVFHCAGALDDATIASLSPEQIERAFAPKANAAWCLHELSEATELSAFVLFSSAAGALGAPGQGGYAAANSFLDALATHRRAKGLAATSIAWGQWQRESAMSAHLGEADLARVARTGMAPLSDEQGLELLDRAIGSGVPATIALSLQPTGLRAQAQAGLLPALFSSLVRVPTRRRQAASSSLAAKLAGLGEAEREAHVLELVRSEVATVLGHETSAQIEPERAFMELGFDSLAAVELRNRLRSATGLRLAATVVFDYPNAKALAGHLLAEATAKGAKQVAVRAQATDEPIAILGMACRYPGGVSSPAELWDLLAEGKDGISQFPADRGWDLERLYHPDPEHPGTSYANQGGFLAAPGDFDAEFFGVSPREALATDPQQRLLLEASWEALEAAGIDPASLRGEPAGVFAGVMGSDYGTRLTHLPSDLEAYMGAGVATSAASGRISYVLGLEGPAMTIDTACSSSLVAIHLAAQALRGGECTLALAGGVTAMSTASLLTGFSRQRGLSADGRCKAFAEGADGIGVSEGVGVLTLARLSDAQRQGHPVLALLKGSAVNQDGASNGLAAPNGPSQERVIRQALANARLAPKDVELLEAHGTGTALGDPIEAGALLATYGQERDKPLKLGSIKSNIGHAQAAAGVAGVIKAVLAMREGVMPKTLHIDEPSSHVEWSEGQIELLREAEPWERNGQPRRAGVSSFGMSGTNAHVILEGAPEPAGEAGDLGQGSGAPSEAAQPLPGPVPLTLSAKSEEALTAQAERLATHLKDNPDLDPTDLAYSLATTRSAFAHRAVAIASSREQALSSLSAVAAGEEAPGIARGLAKADQNPVFLFPGQGSQWQGMGAELLDRSPSFARHMDECEEALSPHLDFSVREVLTGESEEWLERIDVVQPALFAVMVSLARLWEELGVKPAAVLGHSQGEIAAAHLAGGLSLDDAARIVALRAKAMAKIAGKGAMLSVSLSPKQLAPRLEPFGERVSLAAINGPASLVLSGEPESLAELQGSCEQDGVRAQRIAVDYAAHSAQIDDLREELLEAFSPISPQSGHVPFHSTVTGELLDTKELDAEYWYRNLRQPVRFEAVTKDLLAQGQRSFLEISPHPVLAFAAEETIEDALGEEEATYLPTLRRDEGTPERFCLSLAGAHAAGAKVDWEAFFKASGAKRVPLPTYPFQRKRYWLDSTMGGGDAGAIGLGDPEHPLLGAALEDPSGEGLTLTGRLSLATHPWLADHAAAGTVLLPGTAFLELALSAGERVGAPSVEELTIAAPLILTEGAAVALQVKVGSPEEEGRREVSVHSRPEAQEEAEWVRHAQGALLPEQGQEAPLEPPGTWPPQGAEPLELEFLYDRLAEMGLEYGPAFQGLHSAWQEGETIYAEASLPQEQANEAQRFALHPALLDSALHAVALGAGAGMEPRLPFAWSEVSLQSVGAQELRLRLEPKAEGTVSISLFDAAGEPMGRVGSLAARPLDPSLLKAAGQGDQDGLLAIEWRELPAGEPLEFTEISNLSDLAGQEDAEVSAAVLWRVPREEGADPPANALALTATALEQIQAWLADERLAETRLAILTEGAVASSGEEDPDLPAASLWGLLRSAQTEHPERFVLLDTDGSEASAEAIGAALSLEEEPQLAIREGKVLVPRAAPVPVPDTAEEQRPSLDPDKTVLITGATGGLGSLVARHLVEAHGARHLLLASRSGAKAEGAGELLAQLEELGAKAKLASCDVSDPTQLKKLVAQIPKANPLGAVFHCAGALDDATIASLSPEQIERAFAPKANAAWCLHELSEATELSAFVLFSSAAGALGAPGQGGYAAANSFLDALATHRRAKGLAATSIAWGQWQRESAMSAHLGEADLARVARTGMAPLSDEQGLELLDRAIGSGVPATIALSLQPTGLRAQAQAGLLPALFSSLVRVPTRRRQAASSSLAAKLAGLGEAEREAHVLELVRSEVATVLGHETSAQIEPERAFMELGFDSLAAVELRNRLRSATGLRLAATVVFDYPNAKALAGHLLAEATAKGAKQVAVRAQATDEPIAILGMACRYPGGVSSPAELWDLLAEGKDGISQFPADRGWDLERLYHPDPEHPGTSYANQGGFLAAPGDFDAEFFGVSPREALATDPQQRLLLEASWEALEAAGIDPASLRGEPAGVFAGVMGSDYAIGLTRVPEELEGYMGTGVATSAASGRISYVLGLEGPAMTIDTACSSSLVAIHLAAQALRGGECSLALAGGVSVLATPGLFTELSRQRGLAPDGRCKSFAEAADGAGFSEGIGMLALQRLSDAQRQGHPVLALLKGSAVNQDGASNGLSSPNGPSQERVIRQALANARLAPKDVELLEAHGTGTALGDPIEAGALLATYGQERDKPLKLGSIKSNIGHAQAAAGVAGVIKAVLAIREGVMPKTLHIEEPSSHVEWSEGQIELLREAEPWERNGQPRRAGVSSFGMSGTNAHVILEGAPEPAGEAGDLGQGSGAPSEAAQPLPGPVPLTLSAKSEEALAAQAERLASHLKANPDLDPTDLAYSLATTRSSFAHRAVLVGGDREELLGSLVALAQGKETPGTASGLARTVQNPVFLFPGQGSQWQGMGAELLDRSPSFARHMQECEEALSPYLDFSMREVLTGESEEWLGRIETIQPALFAVMVSLARLWEELGVKPAAVLGHSQGEIAAAHLAGGLSLDDAARIAALRSQLISRLSGQGAMASVSLSPERLGGLLEPWEGRIEVAAQNGPTSMTLSAEREALDEFLAQCEQEGVRAREVAATIPSHSARVEPLREELLEALAPISPQSGHVPFHSTVTGELLDTKELDAEYWYRNLRQPVRFEAVTKDLLAQGQRTFLEISPHPVLAFAAEETIEDALGEEEATYLPTLRRDEGTPERFCLSLAGAHAAGAKVEWEAFFKASSAKRVPLPTYPFQRKRYWLDSTMGGGDAGAIGLGDPEHPLLGAALEDPSGEGLTLTGRLSLATHPWLADHAAAGTVLLPGTAFLELALSAGERLGAPSVEELTIAAPLILTEGAAVALQVKVGSPEEEGRREVSVHSRPEGAEGGEWVRHAQGALLPEQGQEAPLEPPGTWPPQGAEPLELEFLYDRLAEMGLEYGPAFQGLHSAWQEGETIYAEASLPQEQANEAQRFALHPALLDSALHAVALGAGAGMEPRLPFAWSEVSLQSVGAQELRLRLEPKAEGTVSISLFDAAGEPMGRVGSLAARPLDPSLLKAAGQGDQDGLLAIEWRELPAGEPLEFTEISNLSDLAGQEDAEVSAAVLWRVPREEGADPPANALALTATALEQIQAWLADERLAETRLAILTEGAVASSGEEDPDLPAASLWGLLRSAQTEHPERFVLLDTDGSEASAEAIGAALSLEEEPQLAIREGKVLVPRAAPVPVPDTAEEQRPSLDPDKTVLITGATGGLGSLVARHLVEAHGARHLLLASRSGAKAEGAGELLAQLEELGAKAKLASCDVSDPTQLKKLVAQIPKANPLGAVFHCAGALDDATIASLSPEQIERAFAPKANAAWCLHELSEATELSAFVLFSSAAGALGAPGQGGYAAANSFLDALATHRRAKGLAATSIAWGQWQRESAMSAHLGEADLARVARTGMAPLSDEQGLELLDRAIGSGVPATIALSLQPTGLRAQAQAGLLPALFSSLVRVPTRRRQAASSSLAAKLAGLGEAEREAHVLELVRSEVATVLGHETSAQIEPERAFMELGFDSLAAVELRNRLRSATGLRLAATVVFDYPNAKALAGHLLSELEPAARNGQGVVEVELDRLGPMLDRLESDEQRERAAERLSDLLAGLARESDDDFVEATDDEMFELLDRKLGQV